MTDILIKPLQDGPQDAEPNLQDAQDAQDAAEDVEAVDPTTRSPTG
ncbi:hypothetical protein HEP84_43370 [Streptomyces sp. RLB1-33]|nr:hypothetical protein [Streptomyces sp. RLB1-33]QIY74894.1 hypothetical protein HEP84_43370 [Streptomyces sp. RLB1-33]